MKYLSAAVVGTLVAFTFILVSRVFLPWQTHEFKPFQDEKVMGIVLKDQTPDSGLYTFPAIPGSQDNLSKRLEWYKAAANGPFYFLAVKDKETRFTLRDHLLIKFGCQFLIAIVMAWILRRMGVSNPWMAGLVAGLVISCGALSEDLRAWTWWSLPDSAALLNIADNFIRWFLAGFAMALVIGKNNQDPKVG